MAPHGFPAEPRVSLLLPNRDNEPVLEEFFEKLAANTTYPDIELIVADDGSSDGSLEILRRWRRSGRFPRFTLLEWPPRGVMVTLNEMFEHVTGEVCVKLDGDVTVETRGWVERMLDFLRSDDRIGLVAPKVVFDSGRIHAYGLNIVCPEGIHDRGTRITEAVGTRSAGGALERPLESEAERGDELAEVDGVLGCWTMFPTALFRELGGYDPAYSPVWYDDIDFSFAARTRGHKVFFLPDVRVIHHAGRRDPRVGRSPLKLALFRGQRRFGRYVPQRVKDGVARAVRIGDSDPTKLAILERHRAVWTRKWGFDPVNPDVADVLRRYSGTEVCWAHDRQMREAGKAIVARHRAGIRARTKLRSLSIVIPAYNEETRLPRLLDALRGPARADLAAAGLELREAIVVDGGSSDQTAAVLRAAEPEIDGLRAVILPGPNRGKGHAVRAGIRRASAELTLITDVDLAAPLAGVARLMAAIDAGADIAVGSRELESAEVRTPGRRRVMRRAFNLATRAVTGLEVRDTQCGLKLLTTGHGRELFDDQLAEGYAFDVELLMRARIAGLSVAEVPVAYVHDEDSRVDVARAAPTMAFDVLRLAFHLRARRSVEPSR